MGILNFTQLIDLGYKIFKKFVRRKILA